MPRKFLKRIIPDHKTIREHRHLQVFGTLLHDPNLWHLNRRSVSGAFAVGLFVAFIPLPFQMVIAAAAAIPLRVNLPMSVVLVWISNPITMPPLFFGAYKLGAWAMQRPAQPFHFEPTWDWLSSGLIHIWEPFLLGCFLVGTSCALLGFVLIRLLWRWQVVRQHRSRRFRNLREVLKRNDKQP